MDADTVAAAVILGGSPESPCSPEAALLVEGVKKIETLKTNTRTMREAQNIRNMVIVLTEDIRVIIIKLAEKLHSLQNLEPSDEDKSKTAARECLDIYAPIAGRLGISWIKNEMEDLSLKFINRDAYQQIKDFVAEKRGESGNFLELVQKAIKNEAKAAGLKIEVYSRAKHFYSIYLKMRKRNKNADEIFDLSGVRIICETIENCYTVLGLVHRLWKPIDKCFWDYIAMPKPNGYQSLHTSVSVSVEGEEKPLEIQIRTGEMHHVAEHGIASHWIYKKGASREVVRAEDIEIANRFREWKQDKEWLEDIKQEIFKKWVYVFTPQGKVMELPLGATPIDFAYHVHTSVGEHCIGAKADGVIIPLNSGLKNTQVVEILTSPSAHPSLNWLRMVKTSRARSKIKSWLDKNDSSFTTVKPAEKTAEKKKPVPEPPAPALNTSQTVQASIRPLESVLQVRVEDEKNMMVRFARCCNPVTGDSITGYVSRGRGIIIHRTNCGNLAKNPEFEERKIEAAWEDAGSALVKRFSVEAKFSANLFSEIEGAIRKRQGHLIEGRLEETADNRLTGFFAMQLMNANDLKPVMKNIRGVPGVKSIQLLN